MEVNFLSPITRVGDKARDKPTANTT